VALTTLYICLLGFVGGQTMTMYIFSDWYMCYCIHASHGFTCLEKFFTSRCMLNFFLIRFVCFIPFMSFITYHCKRKITNHLRYTWYIVYVHLLCNGY
jgi:uncharacterized membrane protein